MTSSILQASKLALVEEVKAALEGVNDIYNELSQRDAQDHTSLHLLAAAGKDDCIDLVLAKAGHEAAPLIALQDKEGDTPLHLCSHCPMVCYQLAAQAPAICLTPNKAGVTPIDLAFKHGTGEALNALLLACSGTSTPEALEAMRTLTKRGAVPDTWAPNGQSSLMLAAAADSAQGVELLLSAGASPELQDAMGRTALMWAAGSGAVASLKALLAADVSVAVRDRRGRTATDYAEQPEVKSVLINRVNELEVKAAAAQEALLAELLQEEARKATAKVSKKAKKKAKAKEKKKGGATTSGTGTDKEETTASTTQISDAQPSAQVQQSRKQPKEEQEAEEEGGLPEMAAVPRPVVSPLAATVAAATCSSSPMKGAWQRGPPVVSLAPYSSGIAPPPLTRSTHISEVPMPALPPGTDAMATGGSTTDEDCAATRSSTPPGPAPLSLPARPPSPEWCTVVKKEKPALKSTAKSTIIAGTSVGTGSLGGIAGLRAGTALGTSSHHGHRRSPSVGSVASASSVGSQETDCSKHSGSERSVLRRPGGGPVNTTTTTTTTSSSSALPHQGNTTSTSSNLVVPRLPAPFQRKAVISRSTSGGGEEVGILVAGGALAGAGGSGSGSTAGASSGGASSALATAAGGAPSVSLPSSGSLSPPPPSSGSKQGTWASVAAQQTGAPSKAGIVRPAVTAAASIPVPAASSVPKAPKPAWGPTAAAAAAPVAVGTQGISKTQQQVETTRHVISASVLQMPSSAFKSANAPSAAAVVSLSSPITRAPASSLRVIAPPSEASAPSPPSTTSASGEATPTSAAAAVAAMAAAAAAHQAAAEEVSVLRGEIQRLRMKNVAAELAHHQELAAVLHDASQHEAAAVAKATSDERMACTVRFASLLQNNGVALASVIPSLLAGAGISTALDLDFFLSSIANNNAGNTAPGPHSGHSGSHTLPGPGPSPVQSSLSHRGKVTSNDETDVLAAMGFRQLAPSTGGVSASRNGSGNLLTTGTEARVGMGCHTVTAPINMAPHPHSHPGAGNATANTTNGGLTTVNSSGGLFETSPLSTSPFSFEVGEHLRGDFLGNHSAFVMPAVESGHPAAHATSPSRSSADSMRSVTAAAAAAAWGVGSGWGDSGQ